MQKIFDKFATPLLPLPTLISHLHENVGDQDGGLGGRRGALIVYHILNSQIPQSLTLTLGHPLPSPLPVQFVRNGFALKWICQHTWRDDSHPPSSSPLPTFPSPYTPPGPSYTHFNTSPIHHNPLPWGPFPASYRVSKIK